jgi:catechol 2,3-dioxygenase-like lactoylglutathione lyase family enzyme
MTARLDMVGLFPERFSEMVAFYRDVLGFPCDWDGCSPYAEFANDGVRFAFYARRLLPELLGETPSYPTGLNGTLELAIDLPRFEEVDAEYARLVAAGARPVYAPRDEPWGMRSSMVADPDGNLIEVGSWNKGAFATAQPGVLPGEWA